MTSSDAWWRTAVIYQVYPRSFADHDGDGMGDLMGVRSRLRYLADLGVDAVWLNPFYLSPMKDGGYDVADYCSVDPTLGTLEDAEQMIREAHALGLRMIFDIVPNHISSAHPWFQEALATPPPGGAWSRFHCLRGRGPTGEAPPNDWRSAFTGSAWSPILAADGTATGWWYLHLFDASQPDVNWNSAEVREEYDRVLRFWFDRGVDGFRIDVSHGLVKAEGYPDSGESGDTVGITKPPSVLPQWDQPGVHEIYRQWRALADSYDPPRMFCAECWVATPERQAAYTRSDELHTAFNFHHLITPWEAAAIRASINTCMTTNASVGAPNTWVLSNHDVWRHVSRFAPTLADGSHDIATGRRRARAASLLMLALPGSSYLYQGEELGLPEVLDLPDEVKQDPSFFRSGGAVPGRDGCRVPLPWSGTKPSYGFGPSERSWLPQPQEWAALSVAKQEQDPGSTLSMYREALRIRRVEPALGDGDLEWQDSDDAVVAFRRTGARSIVVVANTGSEPVRASGRLLVASGPDVLDLGQGDVAVGGDTTVWLSED